MNCYEKGRNRTPIKWFQANRIALLPLSFKALVKQLLHYFVKVELWVKPPRVLLMAHPSQTGFQDAASPIIEELIHFHDHALIVLFIISCLVLYLLIAMVTTKLTDKLILDSQEIEII